MNAHAIVSLGPDLQADGRSLAVLDARNDYGAWSEVGRSGASIGVPLVPIAYWGHSEVPRGPRWQGALFSYIGNFYVSLGSDPYLAQVWHKNYTDPQLQVVPNTAIYGTSQYPSSELTKTSSALV